MSLSKFLDQVEHSPFLEMFGSVQRVSPNAVRTNIPQAKVGALCTARSGLQSVPLEIVSLDPQGHVAMPLDDLRGIRLGDRVVLEQESSTIPVGEQLLGNVIDSMCVSYEAQSLNLEDQVPLYGNPENPMDRDLIADPMDLGVRSINACLTTGKGQRTGIFAGSGVGKSVLLGMMARYTEADVVVIALIGERGREVREFIQYELGEQGRKKSVVVVETADKSPVRRSRGAYVATAICEYFRKQGAHVLLLMDSLTRFAMAQREIGIAAGEPPTTKGYPPSMYASISRIVERAGNWGSAGSITGLFTVLVEGDDLQDPVADNARAILDGHIVLSRRLANRGYYPAVDVLTSVSRVMNQVVSEEQQQQARLLKETLARYQENEDAIHYGMYVSGTDARIDQCIELEPQITEFLRQSRDEKSDLDQSTRGLHDLFTASSEVEAAG